MKHLFNKLSAFLVMLMCVSATVQAEIVHHEVCDPTATSRGFNVECWENTVTNKFYTNEACTQELTGAELAKAVVYAKLPSNPISDNSEFDVVEFDNTQTWGVNLNWAAETTFSNAYTAWSSTPRYAEFTVAGDNVEDARLVWMKNQGAIEQGKYTIKIYVNGIVKTSIVQNETLEGVYVQSLPGLKDGDVVKFEVAQNAQASYNTANPTFKACLEYTSGIYRRIIHHTPCEPTLSTLGFKFECWENTETGKFYSDTGCTQELKDADLARTVVYAKLPESPITKLLYFDGSEHENDWSVDLNWAAKTTFEETNYYLHYRRYAEFTVKDDIASNARLVWNRDQGDVINGRFEVRITVNDNEIYYINQNNREYIEGVFVQTLSELKYGDVVRFDVNQNGYGQSNEAAPTFKACLEYLGHNHTYSNGWCVCTCGYIKEHNHSYANNTCTLCGLIHHVVTEPTVSSPGFTRECWEQVGKFYSDEACTQELKDTDLAKAVIYAKLPESPISNMSEFHQSEHENDWSVDFNWAAVTTFSNAYSGWSSTPRYAEFTATRDDITNARLVWNRNEMATVNGKYIVIIYVNGKEIFSRNQNGGEEFEGVFVQPLPGLKKGDIVKFEVTQYAGASASAAKPSFKACLEYNMPEIAITANENPDEPGAYYSTFYDGQKAYTLSDGATAYTGTISDDNLLLTPIEDGIIPKGEAVIIRSNSGNITLLPSNSTKKKNEDNRLRGSDTDTEAPDGCYILSYGQHSLGFYRYAEGSILAAHKAFLIIQHGALAKAFRMVFADGEADGIEKVSVNDTENSVIYNLNGVRLDKLQKGINIVNGKKIVVK